MPLELGSNRWENPSNGTGLAQILQKRLRLFDQEIAVENGEDSITFRELHSKALGIVERIREYQIRREEPIGILSSPGIDHILSQVAVIYAGGSCVPLDVNLPDQHLGNLLQNLRSTILITDIANRCRIPGLKRIVVDCTALDLNAGESNEIEVSDNGPMCRSHVFHTSGSTGKPKAVQVLATGVINLIFNEFHPVDRGQRLGHVCNIAFDVSLWEIWSGLLHGATIIVFPRKDVLDPWILAQRLRKDLIDVLWQTTSLLAATAHACPQAYVTVDTLLTGGEAINLQTIRTIFANGPPRRLLNAYGPTELSVFATYHEVSLREVQEGCIPIGRPLTNYRVFVVDKSLQEVPDGTVGELLVGGAGVTAGYFGNPEKTSLSFVSATHLPMNCKISTGLFYRTGDLVKRNAIGLIEYIGRRDSEVKIRGQRVELDSVERCFLQTELVSTAVALKVEPEEVEEGAILLAYVVPISVDVSPESIIQRYIQLAPQLMVPRLKVVESLALTGSGKIDRTGLVRDYTEQLQCTRAARNNGSVQGTDIKSRLQNIWLDILDLTANTIKDSDDFFAMGGTSLQASLLVSKIQHSLGVAVRVASLFENSTLKEMSSLIDQTQDGLRNSDNTADMAIWLQDCHLGRNIKPIDSSTPDWKSESEGKVFCTGASGFVGSFFLATLLAMPQVKKIACLVRAKDPGQGLLRIRQAFRKYKLDLEPEQEGKIIVVAGDFSREYLGLGWAQYQYFAAWSSVVFHLGAQVHFLQPYSSHRAANVLGTLNMIRFSNTGRQKSLHYTSTVSAYGPTGIVTGIRHLPEDEKPTGHIAALSYDTGYAQSEFVAETIAWNAIQNGLPITIYRPGFVLGHSQSGIANTDDFYGRLISTCMRIGCFPLTPQHRENFVPVDFVVSTMLHIASDNKNQGHAYNLIQPGSGSGTEISTMFELINRLMGESPMRGIPYSDWIEAVLQTPGSPLLSLMPMLQEVVFGGRTRWEMHQNMPEFGTENLRRALEHAPELLDCPPVSSLLINYVSHWQQCSSV